MEVGTGWLGWTEDQTLHTSMPAIEDAYRGRVKMLQACFGGGEKSGTDETTKPAPPSDDEIRNALRAMAG